MMLAEVSQIEVWMLVGQLLMAVGTIGALAFMAASFNKKQNVAFKQPVTVTISEELHKVFAAKEAFDLHVAENKKDHEQIFSKLGGVERGLRGEFSTELKVVRAEMIEAGRQLAALNNNAEMLNQAMTAERSRLDREIERRREA